MSLKIVIVIFISVIATICNGFALKPSNSIQRLNSKVVLNMVYIPNGLTKEQWEAIQNKVSRNQIILPKLCDRNFAIYRKPKSSTKRRWERWVPQNLSLGPLKLGKKLGESTFFLLVRIKWMHVPAHWKGKEVVNVYLWIEHRPQNYIVWGATVYAKKRWWLGRKGSKKARIARFVKRVREMMYLSSLKLRCITGFGQGAASQRIGVDDVYDGLEKEGKL